MPPGPVRRFGFEPSGAAAGAFFLPPPFAPDFEAGFGGGTADGDATVAEGSGLTAPATGAGSGVTLAATGRLDGAVAEEACAGSALAFGSGEVVLPPDTAQATRPISSTAAPAYTPSRRQSRGGGPTRPEGVTVSAFKRSSTT